MKKITILLDEYEVSHQNATNETIHWICVPSIFFSITGLLYSVKIPLQIFDGHYLNLAIVALILVMIYYLLKSISLFAGMFLFSSFCLAICHYLEVHISFPLWGICLIIFTLAWIGQFFGHKIEGKKPSFLRDIQFLLIGPAWLMRFIYNKLGIKV